MRPGVKGLDHLVLTVRDIAATSAFYTDVLGMRAEVFRAADGTRRVALKFGAQKINLHEAGHEFAPHARCPARPICAFSAIPRWRRGSYGCGRAG